MRDVCRSKGQSIGQSICCAGQPELYHLTFREQGHMIRRAARPCRCGKCTVWPLGGVCMHVVEEILLVCCVN
jgi:hypothetical protein